MSIAVAGCQPEEQIRSYAVPKEVTPTAAPATEPTHRMLAAIVPQGDQAWFFKVVGSIADVDAADDEIRTFVQSIKPQKDQRPSWELPDGWMEEAGTGLRAATIRVPTKSEPLEISVMTLPWPAGGSALLENVNRWRGQLNLPPIGPVVLPQMVETLELDGRESTWVDLKGTWNAGAAMPPFAQRGTTTREMPDDAIHAPAATGTQSPLTAPAAAPFQYKAPESWQPLPATGFRRLAFQIGGADAATLLTVTSFPQTAGPAITDVTANVNRWQRELGMPETSAEEIKALTVDVEVDGQGSTLVELLPAADSNLTKATLAAMIPRGETIWFVKLHGPRTTVEPERERFREFVASIGFDSADGGARGN